MCKSRNIDNGVKCIFDQVILNINVDNTDDSEIDDNDSIGLIDDPNIFVDDEMEISMAESNSNELQEHLSDDNHYELDDISVNNNVEFIFEYEPFPEINHDMMDCALALERMVEHIEAFLDNKNEHICYYCL